MAKFAKDTFLVLDCFVGLIFLPLDIQNLKGDKETVSAMRPFFCFSTA
ncbi:hypothetical protein C943_04514 [Mariniradius saccharolyticus AK6]|uniref:Uncharacterized protein n=1 Tax=Mariniradius saccharolyticus AK6 TaxID=1239962 RepID=M7X8A0_9BACT|nr:hypothetical protein C943_04514 [Mariniradius saccharolyticus AK6]